MPASQAGRRRFDPGRPLFQMSPSSARSGNATGFGSASALKHAIVATDVPDPTQTLLDRLRRVTDALAPATEPDGSTTFGALASRPPSLASFDAEGAMLSSQR